MNTLQKLLGLMILGLLGAGGCASPWEANYELNPDLGNEKFAPSTSVEARTIPFERYEHYVQAERQRRITSTTAPQDLSEQEKLDEKNRLLETLQVRERGDEIDVLGWSEFTYDEPLKPNDPRLIEFAKKNGADYVVVASTYNGQITRTEDRPITTYSQGFTTFRRGRGRHGTFPSTYSDQTTTWVPVQVTRDQYYYEAVFLRKRR